MAAILSVAGSPSPVSRTGHLLYHVNQLLSRDGHQVHTLHVRELPANALLGADVRHRAITETAARFEEAEGIVIGTPIYKAAYSGLLKTLLDLLPQDALSGKTVLPLATGGSTAHVLALDYALRPVLASMGAAHIVPGRFTLDRDITVDGGHTALAPTAAMELRQATRAFTAALGASARGPAARATTDAWASE
ncbi:NADPH-dependent FMN reductase [Streptomyces hebeiensis]|uniref:NADPH-dependent FMN reductase n=1 Tax=Streptomyces hebeiensis TaxID=229486 RepID=A0ABN1URG1_9ACTN